MEKKGDELKGNLKKKHFLIIAIVVFIVIILVLFGARLYLLMKLLIGYDVMIKLSVDKENLFLSHGESEQVGIKTSVITNPFCNAHCEYSFTDLNTMEVLDKKDFDISLADPFIKNYNLTAPALGTGQRLYRFDMECKGIKTGICSTKEELTKRSLLITLDYNLTGNEELIKKETEEKYRKLTREVPGSIYILNRFLEINKGPVVFEYSKSDIESVLSIFLYLNNSLDEFEAIWKKGSYRTVNQPGR